MDNTCTIPNCNNEIFADEFCIFHCKKDTWYTKEKSKNNTEYKKWNTSLVEHFWNDFYTVIATNKDCSKFIFPEFDYYLFTNDIDEDPIHKQQISKINLKDIDFSESIFLSTCSIHNTKIINCNFDRCQLNYLQILKSDIIDCSFHGARFKDANIDGCFIKNVNFQWLSLDYISFTFSRIYDTNFNNSYFRNIELESAVVKDTTFQNTTILAGNIDTFRILKDYYFNLSDNIKGNYFYAKEMQEYCKEIIIAPYYDLKSIIRNIKNYFKFDDIKEKRKENIFNAFKNLFISSTRVATEGLLLIWNYLISNYGQNWLLPLIWLFTISFIIFININPNTSFNINEFAMFLNPFIKNTDKYNDIYAIWLTHKILETIFIYNFIIAIKRRTNR